MARRNNQEVKFGDRVVRQRYAWDAGVRAAVVVFDGTRYPLLGLADEQLAISQQEQIWTLAALRQEASVSFFAVAAARREVAIGKQTVSLRQAWLARVAARAKAGLALRLDVDRARVLYLEAQQIVLEAQARAGDAADLLAGLLGEPPGKAPHIAAPAEVPVPPATDVALDAKARADLEAGRLAITATGKTAESIWWQVAPRLDLVGDAGLGPATFSNPDGLQWSLSLVANWQVWDGGARSARLAGIEAEVREQQLALRRAVRLAGIELQRALRAWRSAHAALAVARQRRAVAEQVHVQVAARFEQGLATSFEVSEAADGRHRGRLEESRSALAVQIAASRHRFLSGLAQDKGARDKSPAKGRL
jgi:outer membrane protein TolC